ncbi:mitochondrial dicarboxylate transporter [Echria macrotheca]|uniref:Mitochondrial dicarboxylate transporter n=1 Tax=Echria macrotheca TaxID=438768 RepID=A0AAJ0BKT3_9PEZI|nr:mitochondrial dicarboxylate transporter [Echria macrotheca]
MASQNASKKQKQPFWLGGAAASMAVCFIPPKSRMQVLQSRTPLLRTLQLFAARDGIPSLWTGLSASVLRQATYSTARFGLFNLFSTALFPSHTILCAALAGGLAGMLGNPAEIVLVRMCADGAKPVSQRFSYPNPIVGLYRIGRDEGVRVFARGMGANIVRSVLMNVSQIAPYAAAKKIILINTSLGDDVRTHALSSLVAGTVATTACAPADVLKSRIQSASKGSSAQVMQVVTEGLRKEGPAFLMKGWTPAWLRLTPHTVLTFVFMEKLQELVTTATAAPVVRATI